MNPLDQPDPAIAAVADMKEGFRTRQFGHANRGCESDGIARMRTEREMVRAEARLIAAIKNANHGATQISFTMLGYPAGASAQCFNLVGYGKMDGKYFVDQMEHSISPSSGYKTQVKASKVEKEDFA